MNRHLRSPLSDVLVGGGGKYPCARLAGTLMRHASLSKPRSVFALAVSMVEAALRGALMLSASRKKLTATRSSPACARAVLLPSVTAGTEVKCRLAFAADSSSKRLHPQG